MDDADRRVLVRVANYQFGRGAGDALFPAAAHLEIDYSTGGRPSQIHAPDGRLASMGTDGRFTLGFAGGRRLAAALPTPANRVVVGGESDPFVREGQNAFAKFVREVDPAVRAGDEVLVTDAAGTLLGVGRAELAAEAMLAFASGAAVAMREGADEYAAD